MRNGAPTNRERRQLARGVGHTRGLEKGAGVRQGIPQPRTIASPPTHTHTHTPGHLAPALSRSPQKEHGRAATTITTATIAAAAATTAAYRHAAAAVHLPHVPLDLALVPEPKGAAYKPTPRTNHTRTRVRGTQDGVPRQQAHARGNSHHAWQQPPCLASQRTIQPIPPPGTPRTLRPEGGRGGRLTAS